MLARQCLDRRIANQDILRGEVNAWQNQRNRDVIRVDWRFTTEDARIVTLPINTKKVNHWTIEMKTMIDRSSWGFNRNVEPRRTMMSTCADCTD